MCDKIRICHICNLGMNGKAVFLCNLLEHMDYEKYDITIIDCFAKPSPVVMDRINKLPVKVIQPNGTTTGDCIKLLRTYFRENRVDVVHSHIWDLSGIFLYYAKKTRVPVRIAHSHNTSKTKNRYGPLKEFLRDKILWNVFRYMIYVNANGYAACSEDAARWLFIDPIIREKKYCVVTNGINLNTFCPAEIDRDGITKVLFAGRLIHQKNPLFVLDVFNAYHKINKHSRLTIIGKGELLPEVQKKIDYFKLRDCIMLVPESNEMAQHYHEADVFLFPSHYEGLGIVLIEAQACGTKCLASDRVPSVTQCGLVKYLPLDYGCTLWAKALDKIVRNQEMALDRSKLEAYSAQNTVKQIDNLYRSVGKLE